MTDKERKVRNTILRIKHFNSLCPQYGYVQGSVIVEPIPFNGLKQKLMSLSIENIERRLSWIERQIKRLERKYLTDRIPTLTTIQNYLRIDKSCFIPFKTSILISSTKAERNSLVALSKERKAWYVVDRMGNKYLLRKQSTFLQGEVYSRLRQNVDETIQVSRDRFAVR